MVCFEIGGMITLLQIKQIDYFLAIADELNMSKAALQLYISQPALSQYLSKLEASLGFDLFIRNRNNTLSLTQAGELYYKAANDIKKTLVTLDRQCAFLKDHENRRLSFGFVGERGIRSLGAVLPKMAKMHSNLHINLIQAPAYQLNEMINNDVIDIAYCAVNVPNPAFDYINLHVGEIDLAMPLNHPLANQGSINAGYSSLAVSLKDFSEEPFVLQNKTTIIRETLDQYFSEIGFTPKVSMEVNSSLSALHIIKSGALLGFCPWGYSNEGVRLLRITPSIPYTVALLYKKNRCLSESMKDFINLFKEVFLGVITN